MVTSIVCASEPEVAWIVTE
jgi:hypothetical protein